MFMKTDIFTHHTPIPTYSLTYAHHNVRTNDVVDKGPVSDIPPSCFPTLLSCYHRLYRRQGSVKWRSSTCFHVPLSSFLTCFYRWCGWKRSFSGVPQIMSSKLQVVTIDDVQQYDLAVDITKEIKKVSRSCRWPSLRWAQSYDLPSVSFKRCPPRRTLRWRLQNVYLDLVFYGFLR